MTNLEQIELQLTFGLQVSFHLNPHRRWELLMDLYTKKTYHKNYVSAGKDLDNQQPKHLGNRKALLVTTTTFY